jgi:predicted alpha/beta hydrolase family esterase
MTKVIIFHGTVESPDSFWYPWLAQQLRERGYEVTVPFYPDINRTHISKFLPQILNNHTFDEETILIGHSAGGPLLLSILESIDATVPQALLVAGLSMRLEGEPKDPILQDSYDWKKIKQHVKDIIFVNSTNDPWGCDEKQGRIMFDHLGGTQIIRNDGHFGSGTYNQPYRTFDLLDKLIA